MPRFICFQNREHLMTVWHLLRPARPKAVPDEIFSLKSGRFAVPVSFWASDNDPASVVEKIGYLSPPYGWKFELLETLTSDLMPRSATLADLASGPWLYRDPIAANRLNTSGPSLVPGAMHFNPRDPALRYILGAETEAQAGHVLQALTQCRIHGIKAKPVEFKDSANRYGFFWVITRGQIFDEDFWANVPPTLSFTVADVAARVWWSIGPHGIFLQWPYELNVAQELLEMIHPHDGLVLLSKEPPHRTLIHQPADAPEFSDLIEVVELTEAPGVTVSETVGLTPDQAQFHFPVTLDLVPKRPREMTKDHIQRLTREIEAKQAIRDRLEAALGSAVPPAAESLQPLFLYLSEQPNHMPNDLGRLLIEWADQEQDLRGLQYVKLAPESLPREMLVKTAAEVHVVTTSTALGKPGSRDLGLRLREYYPQLGADVAYELLPDWAAFGLRIFIPLEKSLEIYPRLQPQLEAAAKLAAALLGGRPRNEWCALLKPATGKSFDVVLIKLEAFRPLLEAFDWQCSMALHLRLPEVLAELTEDIPETAAQVIGAELSRGVTRIVNERLKEENERLRTFLTNQDKRLTAHLNGEKQALDASRTALQNFQQQVRQSTSEIRARLNQIHATAEQVDSELTQLTSVTRNDAHAIQTQASKLASLDVQLREVETLLTGVRQAHQKVVSNWPASKPPPQGNL